MISGDLEQWIVMTLPGGEGWWHFDDGDQFIRCANRMADAGMQEADIKNILSDLYHATSNEYGN